MQPGATILQQYHYLLDNSEKNTICLPDKWCFLTKSVLSSGINSPAMDEIPRKDAAGLVFWANPLFPCCVCNIVIHLFQAAEVMAIHRSDFAMVAKENLFAALLQHHLTDMGLFLGIVGDPSVFG